MLIVNPRQIESEVLNRLLELPEVQLSGFSARAGLTGAGITIMKNRSFYGSWRVSCGALVWSYAHTGGTTYFAASVDDAVRHTMLLVLRSLESQSVQRVA
ncbi:MAG: hypothetical protein ABL907_20675 [Hyphomicrobium sp.]